MRPNDKQDHRPDCRLSSFTPSSPGTTAPVTPHRPRPDELWASPQRLRYLRSLTPETPPGHPAHGTT